jgi:hypothetical protein
MYSKFGKTVCYSFFTNIASFTTDFTILYAFLKFPVIDLVTNHNVPVPQSQILVCFWLLHLQIILTRSLRRIQFLLSVVPVSLNHYNFVTCSLFPTWLSIRLIQWATFCFTVNLSFHLPQSLVILCSEKGLPSSLESRLQKKNQ